MEKLAKIPSAHRMKRWSPNSSDQSAHEGEVGSFKQNYATRIWESFKRDPNASVTRSASLVPGRERPTIGFGGLAVGGGGGGGGGGDGRGGGGFGSIGEVYDADEAARATAASPLSRKLKGRHLQMIAIGGSIGTGLFVGSGRALALGGPASVLLSFGLIGVMMYCTVQALGELAVLFPVAGSFAAYSTRFLDPAWGFAMGWNYAINWLVTMPLEIVSASITIDYWTGPKPGLNAAWISIFLVLIVSINFFGVKGYGEAEFCFSVVKITAIIGYIILGTVINIGGGPNGTYIGGMYWRDPGAFNHGFKGLCSTFVTAAFAFGGTELVGLAAAETENPRKTLPSAIKQVFWRITLFYIVSLLIVGLLVPFNNPRLLSGVSPSDAKASPFVLSIQNAGIQGLPSVMNVVIMISVLSVGNSAVYGSSRTLAALAEQRQAPRIMAYIDRKGRPLVTIGIASILGILAYLGASSRQQDAFNWMISIAGLSSIFTWTSICLSHIRFRYAWQIQGHTLDELAFKSPVGVIGSYVGVVINILILIAQFWTGFAPVGFEGMSASARTVNFFQAYLAAPIVLISYLGYKFVYKTKIMEHRDMDLHTGKRDLDVRWLLEDERADRAKWPGWKKVYKFFC